MGAVNVMTALRRVVAVAEAAIAITLPPEFVEAAAQRAAEILVDRVEPPNPYLAVAEAADYLRCKPKRVYDLCSQRRIPFVKDGSRTLLRRVDLDAYLEAQRG